MPHFKDSPLKPDHIRLFKFVPSSSTPTTRITIQTQTFNIYRAPTYQCISYCWGDISDGVENIICNDEPLEVGINLHAALKRLWRHETSNSNDSNGCKATPTANWYWNDAISIEQGPSEIAQTEKARQIAFMETIFPLSDPVLVWLGDASEEEERAFQYLADTCGSLAREGVRGPGAGLPPATDDVWQLWARVMVRPWFARLWIVQECIFINGRVIVMLGSRAQTTWTNFHEVVRRTMKVPWMRGPLDYGGLDERAKRTVDRDFMLEYGMPLDEFENKDKGRDRDIALRECVTRNLVNIRELMDLEKRNDTEFGYFHQILKVFGNRKCAYDQDRPNAMRGIIPDKLKKGLKVYGIHADVTSVYREVSRVWLLNDPMLSLFQRIRPQAKFMPTTHTQMATKRTNPSWAIDLGRVVTQPIGDGIVNRTDGFHAGLIRSKTLLGKSEWAVPETRLLSRMKGSNQITFPNDRECHVAGVQLGVVEPVVYSTSNYQSHNAAEAQGLPFDTGTVQWIQDSLELIQNVVRDRDYAREIHWRTLIFNRTYVHDPAVQFNFDIEDKHSRQEAYLRALEISSTGNTRLLQESDDDTKDFCSTVSSYQLDFPSWFATSTGGHVGRSLSTPMPGDVVAVFYGAATPFLLRPIPGRDTVEFMGEAYVHGVMQGEILSEKNKRQYPRQTFKLV